MQKLKLLIKLKDSKIVSVVRADSKKEALKIIDSVIEGGINAIEVTYTISGASEVIKEASKKYEKNKNIIIGAGSVLDPETARLAILSGAKFIVGPNLNKEVSKLANRYQIPYIPGCMTINEVLSALEIGVDIVKLFPGGAFGPKMIKDIKGPLPQVNIMPTGGVNLENIKEWFEKGAVCVGVGSDLTKYAKTNDYKKITEQAKKYIKKIK